MYAYIEEREEESMSHSLVGSSYIYIHKASKCTSAKSVYITQRAKATSQR